MNIQCKSSNWLTKWYPNLAIHKWMESKNQRIPKKPKLSNFTLYFKSNCTCKSTPKFGLKINSRWSNVKLKGQMMMKFYDFSIHRKLMKDGIQWTWLGGDMIRTCSPQVMGLMSRPIPLPRFFRFQNLSYRMALKNQWNQTIQT